MSIESAFEISKQFNAFLEAENLIHTKEKIDEILKKNRTRPGALIPVLQEVQNLIKFLPPSVQNYIASSLNVPASNVYGVVSFYSFFSMKPKGRNIIKVCLGTACYVKGAPKIIDKIERSLNIKLGDTTADKRYTLEGVRCLGACGLAPVVMVNEETLGLVDPGKIMKQLDTFK